MCGRFVQDLTAAEYLEALRIEVEVVGGFNPESIGLYTVAPRTRVLLIHWEAEGLRRSRIRHLA